MPLVRTDEDFCIFNWLCLLVSRRIAIRNSYLCLGGAGPVAGFGLSPIELATALNSLPSIRVALVRKTTVLSDSNLSRIWPHTCSGAACVVAALGCGRTPAAAARSATARRTRGRRPSAPRWRRCCRGISLAGCGPGKQGN